MQDVGWTDNVTATAVTATGNISWLFKIFN